MERKVESTVESDGDRRSEEQYGESTVLTRVWDEMRMGDSGKRVVAAAQSGCG